MKLKGSLVALLALGACAQQTPDSSESLENAAPAAVPAGSAEQTGEAQIAARAADILSRMTIEEKIGQILQADIASVTPDEARRYNLGSVLNGGNSAPGGGKTAEPAEWVALADAFWDASTDTSDGGVGVPLLWGTDAVHGHNNLQTATLFPHNAGLGAAQNPELMRRIGDVTAREIRATGLDWTFAPTLAVARDDRWGRTYESYSENPDLVAAYAAAIIEGLQGAPGEDDFLTGENVMATAKHFIGDGGTQLGIDKGDTLGEHDDILRIHGAGYGPAIDAQVQSVMASFSSVNGEKMHGSSYWLTDVLRDQMGFDGFVVGDWNGHAEVPGCDESDCPQSLLAGVDMYMAPDSWKDLYESLLADAQEGSLDLERLDEAVLRILTVKIRSGLLDAGRPSQRAATDVAILGRDEHRAVARQAVRESLVLLKNDGGVLPLAPGQTILVAGSGADSMQQQTGGWTLNWQGTGNANEEFKTGETIFSGIKQAAEAHGGTALLSPDGSFEQKPDAAIVVYGEHPYAEYVGDRGDLVFEFDGGENLELIEQLTSQDIPVVSVFLTGRPLWVNPHLNASDAFVVAWLPGSEGGGVADVLLADGAGAPRHDFSGRLAFSWPADGTGAPINDATDPGVLFAFGFGRSFAEPGAPLGVLSEDPGVANAADRFDGQIIERGQPAASFQMFLGDSSNRNVPVVANAAESLGGGVSLRGVDYKAQEDARLLAWSGNGSADFSVRAQRPLDLTELGEPDELALSLTLLMGDTPSDTLVLSMACGDGCEGEVDLDRLVSGEGDGDWRTIQIPLACLVSAGLDPTNVTEGLRIASGDRADLAIHAAAIEALTRDAKSCP